MKMMQIAGYIAFLLIISLLNVPTAQAQSPTIRVGIWNEFINCGSGFYRGAVTSVSKHVDIDTYTRDALPQELSPSVAYGFMKDNPSPARVEQAHKAQAIMIRSAAYHYSYNPQSNDPMLCDRTGQGFEIRNSTIEGWLNGRGAIEGNVEAVPEPWVTLRRTNDLVTETMGQILYKNNGTWEPYFNRCLQEEISELAEDGHNYYTILTNGVYNQASCGISQYTGLSVRSNSYSFRSSMTNGTYPSLPYNWWEAQRTTDVTPANVAREAEHFWGHSHMDIIEDSPFGQTGRYITGWHQGDKVEYLMTFGSWYGYSIENLHLIGISDRPGPVTLNIYVDGKYQRQIQWTEDDNQRHLRVEKIPGIFWGMHAIAIEFANDVRNCTNSHDCDRNFYFDMLGTNNGDINRSRVRNMFLRNYVFLPVMLRD